MKTRTSALTALFAALAAAIGYLFVAIPNLEFITAVVFIAGCILGIRRGILVGALGELIFSLMNPFGVPALPILIAQTFSLAAVGAVGGVFYRLGGFGGYRLRGFFASGLVGFLLTVFFDVLTTLSFAVFLSGWDRQKIAANFLYGLGFYAIHIAVNTLTFAIAVPLLVKRLETLRRSIA
ncbi:ECF transporter S component [candidate division KSB1 bacterium]|nr:ECF transporter S component [candidate division KSB1 bacterium]